jgi:ADP-ribose pyrophosphatase
MPFKTLNQKIQYHGHAFDVALVHVQLPDGRERNYDLVKHKDSITVLPVGANGEIYFVNQHRIGAGGDLLELPAGVQEAGEDPLACARREIREEIGLAAEDFKELGGFYLAPGYTEEYMTVFLAMGLYESPLEADADEFLEVKSFTIEEVYRKALAGEFHDGKTLAALLLAQPLLDIGGEK